jgi:hypothetical protein
MYEELIKKIVDSFDEDFIVSETYPKFSGEGYKAEKIDINNFHELKPSINNRKIAFVDGGNAEILGSANFSLNLIRVCYTIYQNNRKFASKKLETLAFVHALNQNNEIHYKACLFSKNKEVDLDELSFSSFDKTLTKGINRAEIGTVVNAIRRFIEIKTANLISDNKIANIIVMDGNLQGTITHELKFLNSLYDSCVKNNVVLCAISKTNSLFTDNGNLFSVVLDNISKLPSWYYNPIVKITSQNHKAEMFLVKFHKKSKHIFKLEIFNEQNDKAVDLMSELAGNCNDPIFIGYPYGLVETDRAARVSNNEKESLKTMFLLRLKNKNVERRLNSVNSHQVLDKISF